MAKVAYSIADDFCEIDLLLSQSDYGRATVVLAQRLCQNPLDRESRLYLLLINVIVDGPTEHEDAIDQLRTLSGFNEIEKEIVRRLYVLGVQSAEKEGREAQAWAYQRLLRRLLLGQPLDQSIPKSVTPERAISEKHVPRPKTHRSYREGLTTGLSTRRLALAVKELWSFCIQGRRIWQASGNLGTRLSRLFRLMPATAVSFFVLTMSGLYLLSLDGRIPRKPLSSVTLVPARSQGFVQKAEAIPLVKQTETLPHHDQSNVIARVGLSPSLDIDGRKQTVKVNQEIAESEIWTKPVIAVPDRTKSEEPTLDVVDYRTLRITPTRQEPRFGASVIEEIEPGTVISVLETNGDWFKIKTRTTGNVGYVRKEYVTPVSTH